VKAFDKEEKAREWYSELTYCFAKILYQDGRVFERPQEINYDN
jgi:hypothetical protein